MLKNLVYYRTGGSCDTLYQPETRDELAAIIQNLDKNKAPFFIIGGGTNSLVSDEHWQGTVLSLQRMKKISVTAEHSLLVEAGVNNTDLAQKALKLSWSGLAWMNRLPGQLGGTIRMNARCYGGEVSQVVSEVYTVTKSGTLKTYVNKGNNLFTGYKDTIFMSNGDIITGAKIKLSPGNKDKIAAFMEHCASDRISKGQFLHPSCGSVFKNDYSAGVPSGMLLDRAQAHKLNQKHIGLNPQHANFVFNKGASSRDIINFTLAMRDLVYDTFGVWLEYEVEMLGTFPQDLKKRVLQTKPPHYNEKLLALREEFQNRQTSNDS